jgi:hypothetical protein
MTPADLELPDDVDALKAMIMAMSAKAARADVLEDEVADLKARNADADEQIAKLKLILKAFNRYRYGRRSEKQGKPIEADLDEQGAFVFEEIDTGIAAIEALVSKGRNPGAARRAPRPRKGLPPVRRPPLQSLPISTNSGRTRCPASLENQSSPKQFAMPLIGGKPSNSSSMTGASR